MSTPAASCMAGGRLRMQPNGTFELQGGVPAADTPPATAPAANTPSTTGATRLVVQSPPPICDPGPRTAQNEQPERRLATARTRKTARNRFPGDEQSEEVRHIGALLFHRSTEFA